MSVTLESLTESVKSLVDQNTKIQSTLEAVQKESKERQSPFIRKGENILTSRGYQFTKLFQVMKGIVKPEDAKVEVDMSNKLAKAYDNMGYVKAEANSVLVPFASELIADMGENKLAEEVHQVVKAGSFGYDPNEVSQLRMKQWGVTKALSWIDETTGGALVAPPLMGELIQLLRNNEALMAAGARTIALPPNGRLTFPRQTSASQANWVGEKQTITDSTQGTGDVVLSAKKLGVVIKVPNELFRFASISVEQFVREDMARVLALKLDKTLLEDQGSTLIPKGLINYANIAKYTSLGAATNGDIFAPEDVLNMIGTVEEQNAIFKSFIMRPLMYAAIANRRGDSVTPGDHAGMFLFNLLRGWDEAANVERTQAGRLNGYNVVKSTQVSNARTKGSSSNLSYILGGDFNDYLMALGGVMEFAISTQGDTPFAQDQTWLRGILYCDGAVLREASFVVCDNLQVA